MIIVTVAAEGQSKTFMILTVGKNLWQLAAKPSVMSCCTSSPSNPGPVLENPAIIFPN